MGRREEIQGYRGVSGDLMGMKNVDSALGGPCVG